MKERFVCGVCNGIYGSDCAVECLVRKMNRKGDTDYLFNPCDDRICYECAEENCFLDDDSLIPFRYPPPSPSIENDLNAMQEYYEQRRYKAVCRSCVFCTNNPRVRRPTTDQLIAFLLKKVDMDMEDAMMAAAQERLHHLRSLRKRNRLCKRKRQTFVDDYLDTDAKRVAPHT